MSSRQHPILDVSEVGVVKAAGGIVSRPGPGGLTEVVVIHRDRYDDWTLPKGKLEPGEAPEAAALREVEEETGLTCRLLEPVGCTGYVMRNGRDKIVCFWAMQPLRGSFRPGSEVDSMRWLTIAEALEVLTYARERALLLEFEEPPPE